MHCGDPQSPSIYRRPPGDPWRQFAIDVDHRLGMGTIQLRWRQMNPSGVSEGEFALRGIYAGPPCFRHCHGHGQCIGGSRCICQHGYSGKYCGQTDVPRPRYLLTTPSKPDAALISQDPRKKRHASEPQKGVVNKKRHGSFLFISIFLYQLIRDHFSSSHYHLKL